MSPPSKFAWIGTALKAVSSLFGKIALVWLGKERQKRKQRDAIIESQDKMLKELGRPDLPRDELREQLRDKSRKRMS